MLGGQKSDAAIGKDVRRGAVLRGACSRETAELERGQRRLCTRQDKHVHRLRIETRRGEAGGGKEESGPPRGSVVCDMEKQLTVSNTGG